LIDINIKYGLNVIKKPVEEYVEYAVEHGIGHLEIDLMAEHSFIESFTRQRIKRLVRMSRESGISLSLHTPFSINPVDPLPALRDATFNYLRKCLVIAHQIHATHLTTHVGYVIGLGERSAIRALALERLVGVLEKLVKISKVPIAVENVNPMPEESEFFYLADNVNDLDVIFSSIPSKSIGLCLDIGHAHTNEGAAKYIQSFGDKIINVHYHDNRGKNDDHLPIGEGSVPWKEVLRAFSNIGYTGPFVSECSGVEPHEAKSALERIFSIVQGRGDKE